MNFKHHFELEISGCFCHTREFQDMGNTAVTCLQPKSIFVHFILLEILTYITCTLQKFRGIRHQIRYLYGRTMERGNKLNRMKKIG